MPQARLPFRSSATAGTSRPGRITSWSQQAGTQPPSVYTFGYDSADQLLSAWVTNGGALAASFSYSYDPAGNRLTEQANGATNLASYNALNQLSTVSNGVAGSRTNEWDAENRLTAVTVGNQRTEFAYDGLGRRVSIRQLVGGTEVSLRRFVWSDDELCEERDATGAVVTKRFFPQGMRIESGPSPGAYYYTRDHLGSIRELTDGSGAVRARYSYDPYGRRTKSAGDVDADFGFTGMFWSNGAALGLTRFRAYDPELGRWLSRDPFEDAELDQGPNLYAFVEDNPINLTDPLGLCCEPEENALGQAHTLAYNECRNTPVYQNMVQVCGKTGANYNWIWSDPDQLGNAQRAPNTPCEKAIRAAQAECALLDQQISLDAEVNLLNCLRNAAAGGCKPKPRPPPPAKKPPRKKSPPCKKKRGTLADI